MNRPTRTGLAIWPPLLLGVLILAAGCAAMRVHSARSGPAKANDFAAYAEDGLAHGRALDGLASVEESGGEVLPALLEPGAADPSPRPAHGERLLVYSGRFSIAVPSVEEGIQGARRMAGRLGGWVQGLGDDTIVIRVPAATWEDTLAGLRDLGRILSRAIEAQDVTEEVIDLRLRLKNALALRQRLEELLAQAKTVEVTLKVEAELNRIRTEVERIEGRLQRLADRVAFSTLTIRFVPVEQAPTRLQALPFPWLRDLGIEGLLGLRGGVR